MKTFTKTLICLMTIISISGLTSCAHGKRLKGKKKKSKEISKVEKKKKSRTKIKGKTADDSGVEVVKFDVTKINISALVLRLSGPNPGYSDEDKKVVDALVGNSKPGSYEEAALALGVILESVKSKKETEFEETDLYPQVSVWKNAVKKAKETSIEAVAEARKIDIATVLLSNPILQSHRIQAMALSGIDIAYTSEAFRNKLRASIKKQAITWAALGTKVGIGYQNQAPPTDIATTPVDDDDIKPALRFGASDFRSDDGILQEAQALADRGQYRRSVARLGELKEDSPLYAAAQEKIRESSNKAVQKLRRLAAKAFQSAIPVSDLAAKSTYLKTARKHLESALSNFPEADQLSTVRENLSVINRDLLRISESLTKPN